MKKYEIISLGSYCLPRAVLTRHGLKASRLNGELTLPFDLVDHNAAFITEMIEQDFNGYFDDIYFDEAENHWSRAGKTIKFTHDDFTADEKHLLFERCTNRIKNFRQTITTDLPVLFVQAIKGPNDDVNNLYAVLKRLRGSKPFELAVIDIAGCVINAQPGIKVLHLPYPYQGYQWFEPDCYLTESGKAFESRIIDFCKTMITENLNCQLVQWENQFSLQY